MSFITLPACEPVPNARGSSDCSPQQSQIGISHLWWFPFVMALLTSLAVTFSAFFKDHATKDNCICKPFTLSPFHSSLKKAVSMRNWVLWYSVSLLDYRANITRIFLHTVFHEGTLYGTQYKDLSVGSTRNYANAHAGESEQPSKNHDE